MQVLYDIWNDDAVTIKCIINNQNGITIWRITNIEFEIFAVFIGIGNPEPKTIPIFEGLTEEQAIFLYNSHII